MAAAKQSTTRTARSRKTTKTAEQVALEAEIPEQRFADEYISRTIDGILDIDLLRYARDAGKSVLLSGPTGPGKTSAVLAYCAADQIPLVTIQCNGGVDPAEFFGRYIPTFDDQGHMSLVWQDSMVTTVIKHGGVLYFDEVNMLHPKISAVFHSLIDKRRQVTVLEMGNTVIKAADSLQVIGAYNPDYAGTRSLNAAFKNRFSLKLHFDYDRGIEQRIICTPVMLDLADKLREAHRNGDLETPTSTNMLAEFEDFAIDLGVDFAITNFLNAFSEDEKPGVRKVMDLLMTRIHDEMEQLAKMSEQADDAAE